MKEETKKAIEEAKKSARQWRPNPSVDMGEIMADKYEHALTLANAEIEEKDLEIETLTDSLIDSKKKNDELQEELELVKNNEMNLHNILYDDVNEESVEMAKKVWELDVFKLNNLIKKLKLNNTDLILRNKVLRERPDLPVDRIPAIEKYEKQIEILTIKGENLCNVLGAKMMECLDKQKEIDRLNKIIYRDPTL